MIQPSSAHDRARLLEALRHAWSVERKRVDEFGLELLEDQIRPSAGGWAVPVLSVVPTGSAYELARTLDRLAEIAEQVAGQSISLYLDPFANVNGTR